MSNLANDPALTGPSGIGGWLILPIIGFIGPIVLTLVNLSQALKEIDGLVAIFEATSGPLAALKIPTPCRLLPG
jgi:hypothetical protein